MAGAPPAAAEGRVKPNLRKMSLPMANSRVCIAISGRRTVPMGAKASVMAADGDAWGVTRAGPADLSAGTDKTLTYRSPAEIIKAGEPVTAKTAASTPSKDGVHHSNLDEEADEPRLPTVDKRAPPSPTVKDLAKRQRTEPSVVGRVDEATGPAVDVAARTELQPGAGPPYMHAHVSSMHPSSLAADPTLLPNSADLAMPPLGRPGPQRWSASPTSCAIVTSFTAMLRWFLPKASTNWWKQANYLAEPPAGYQILMKDALLVFSLTHSEVGNPIIGATLFRLDAALDKPRYLPQGRAFFQLDRKSAMICQCWTDLSPPPNVDSRGIFFLMMSSLTTSRLRNKPIHVFLDDAAFAYADECGRIDASYQQALCIFEKDTLWM